MAQAKAFIFAPADSTGETHQRLEQAGCELVLGQASWHSPQGNSEDEMCLLACDPYIEASKFILHGVQAVDLPTLLLESDVLSLHVALSSETRRMIGEVELAMMKPTAVLINTSRGQVVDETALVSALRQEKITAAALDVFEVEPLSAESPLRSLGEKVLLAPHMASQNIRSGLGPGILWATQSVFSALSGEVPDNVYNKEVIPRWRERFEGRRLLGVPTG